MDDFAATDLNLLSLGMFVFSTNKTAIDEIQRKTSWRWAKGNAVGVRPIMQFTGPDNDKITLPGILYPELTDGTPSLNKIRAMGNTGKFYALVGGSGEYFGIYAITDLDETRSYLLPNGMARKIEFSISLELQDDSDRSRIAVLGGF